MYKVGQLLKNKKRNPTSYFLITKVYYREYPDGIAERVNGVCTDLLLINEELLALDLNWDARSIERCYPFTVFKPLDRPEEDK